MSVGEAKYWVSAAFLFVAAALLGLMQAAVTLLLPPLLP